MSRERAINGERIKIRKREALARRNLMANEGSFSKELPQQISFAMIHPSSSSSSMHGSLMRSKEAGAYDLGELDQALFFSLDEQDHSISGQEQRQTLNIFPSQPMHVQTSTKGGKSLASPATSGSKKSSDQTMELGNSPNDLPELPEKSSKDTKVVVKKEGSRKSTCVAESEGPKTTDTKTLRRLAQNREAARKSRLRKKAYIQQLESSRNKLSQLEQEIQRARGQGLLYGGGALLEDQGLPTFAGGLSSDAAVFDMEYTRWLEEHHRLMCELRAAVEEQQPENKLQMFVDSCLAHYDHMAYLKSIVTKSDVFHLISGVWMTPAERCFMWMGGFRPSELIKMLSRHIEPLTEQQILGVCGLQQSTQETEEALSQGLEALNLSLSDTITSDALSCLSHMDNYMGQMAVAVNKLATLEGFIRQADNLRQHTLHRLYQILTTRQMARCLLAIAEYFHRLRALSSLWLARPRHE
ncbi:bZIP transcription factor TGA10 isoform X1 [Musa acuminata AAA Group]|uniref:bZIP transcription factor TGA10 isoform X1 n=3 Tax=Musa acuminata AAA Group TaxID=214697 RepID=UPI0031D045CC